ncbi:MAG TPA: tetratricopeptide repeat protein, partial [Candidatus Binataceae bacterium]
DPGLYQRLAVFLDQNRLGAQQEEVYRRAMARFPDRSWWDKLARFYLRQRRDSEFEQLTRQAVESFNGTDLEEYFKNVWGSQALYLRLNQYANRRFPHNSLFVRNLLRAYHMHDTYDEAAWEALIRQHWFEESDLRNEFFEFLSRTDQLESELAKVEQMAPDAASWENNPVAADFIAQANLWRSHFEQSAPELESLAKQYPAETELARTASSVYRSLAYFDPSRTAVAAKIEINLSHFNPRDTETLSRIGDIYADSEQFTQAAPYWERIPQVAPGQPGGYLEAATIYWDYFDFPNALRVLKEGRVHLNKPNLYSYEAGAIHENQRDYPNAIDEYVKGALENPGSSAEFRLVELARRPKLRDLVDRATARAAVLPNPPMPAVYLRVKVLEAQNRKPEMESFLDAVVGNVMSLEQAEAIGNLAQEKSLETLRQHALEKQLALTTDPVRRLELRYSLVRLFESHKDFPQAESNMEALYEENPKILGVVRSTVDFYWNAKRYPQAITVLVEAAKTANPDLKKQFTYEAARKATDAKNFEQARELLTSLLASDAYNGEYLAAMADAYARAGDDTGLEQFYRDKITVFRSASLSPDMRKTQISSLRRGLIPALTRNRDYSGAVDQYIELINSFPEDDALVTEAALYTARYQRQSQLIDFYSKAVAESPRDYRWAMVLARIYTNLENYSPAIDTYSKAVKIRPDRSDLLIARAGLEERLMHFDDAAADYLRIYQLNYKDPQWMEKLAETRARQGRTTDTVVALKTALIDGRPENALNYFEVARRLEAWGMLDEARGFAEQGVSTAGADLLAEPQFLNGAKTYVRILTRLRKPEDGYDRMETALSDASAMVKIVEEQVARQGITSITNQAWRAQLRQNRIDTARNGMAATLEEMGNTVNAYSTPEERLSFAAFVEAKRKLMSISEVEKFAIPLAQSATLADQEARWRFEVLSAQSRTGENYAQIQPLIELERHRGRFKELAKVMEQFAATCRPGLKTPPLVAAADAYRSAGDQANELRMWNAIFDLGTLDTTHQQRFFELALARDPDELVRIAGRWIPPG